MAILTRALPAHEKHRASNLRRWAELLADPQLARLEGRLETDRHGHILMSPGRRTIRASARSSPTGCGCASAVHLVPLVAVECAG